MSTVLEPTSFEEEINTCLDADMPELIGELRELELQRRHVDARTAAITSVLQARGGFPDGHRSLKALLRAELNVSGISAHRQRQIASLVDRFPVIGDEWLAGRVGRDQVVELAKVFHHRVAKHCFADFVDQLLEAAVRFEFDEFMLVIQRFMLGADPDGAHDDRDAAIEGRRARLVVNGEALDVAAHGGEPLIAHELKTVFDYYEQQEFNTDLAARKAEWGNNASGKPLPRTAPQRRFDAFVAMIRAAGHNTDVDTSQPVAEFCVNIVIDENRFNQMLIERDLMTNDAPSIDDALADYHAFITGTPINEQLDIAPRCETDDGTPLHPHDILKAALTGHIRRVICDTRSVVVDMGWKHRLFTGSARTAAKLLATRCSHPGCDLPADICHVDHNTPWAHGGPTNQHNSNIPCGHHNNAKEQLGLRYIRDKYGHRRAIRPDGTYITPVGMPDPEIDLE